MDIEESSGPYRGFRSGSYPAITKRIADSGGVLLRASSWFALIVTAASAGYNMTQRLVSESAVSAQVVLKAPTLPRSAAAAAPVAVPKLPAEQVASVEPQTAPVQEPLSADAPTQHASAPAMPVRTGSLAVATPAIKDKQRVVLGPHKQNQSAAHGQLLTAATPDVEASASEDASRRTAQRVREQESEPHLTVKEPAYPTVTEAVPAAKSSAAIEINVEAESTPVAPMTFASTAPKSAPPAVVPPLPSIVHVKPIARAQAPVQLPLAATARIDGLTVNGSVTAANLRHGLERVQPLFAECYSQAAQRAGQNRFSQVRVALSIDETGRVKTQPSVEGAELPGLQACLSSAFSKLVCRAPDTGAAKASMTLRFSQIASTSRAETR